MRISIAIKITVVGENANIRIIATSNVLILILSSKNRITSKRTYMGISSATAQLDARNILACLLFTKNTAKLQKRAANIRMLLTTGLDWIISTISLFATGGTDHPLTGRMHWEVEAHIPNEARIAKSLFLYAIG
jgi:hypothetical protein